MVKLSALCVNEEKRHRGYCVCYKLLFNEVAILFDH
jgi:hypothetical protein